MKWVAHMLSDEPENEAQLQDGQSMVIHLPDSLLTTHSLPANSDALPQMLENASRHLKWTWTHKRWTPQYTNLNNGYQPKRWGDFPFLLAV